MLGGIILTENRPLRRVSKKNGRFLNDAVNHEAVAHQPPHSEHVSTG